MRFPLKRFYQDERQTLGTLMVGAAALFTIELPWRNSQPSLSCIPEGRYRMTIVDVDGEKRIRLDGAMIRAERTLINIEVSNYAAELAGCIGLGLGVCVRGDIPQGIYMITNSAKAYEIFSGEIVQRIDSGVSCWLEIDDVPSR